jgi:hypothetical protein
VSAGCAVSCRKRAYTTKRAAKQVVRWAQAEHGADAASDIYKCPSCGLWHVTKRVPLAERVSERASGTSALADAFVRMRAEGVTHAEAIDFLIARYDLDRASVRGALGRAGVLERPGDAPQTNALAGRTQR